MSRVIDLHNNPGNLALLQGSKYKTGMALNSEGATTITVLRLDATSFTSNKAVKIPDLVMDLERLTELAKSLFAMGATYYGAVFIEGFQKFLHGILEGSEPGHQCEDCEDCSAKAEEGKGQ